MFRTNTVIVVGAGASSEVGLPLGDQLLEQIVKRVHITYEFADRQKTGDPVVAEALRHYLNEGSAVSKYNDHISAAWQLSSSATQALSIDNIIDALEDKRIELVGKLGIVRSILAAEAESGFFTPVNHQSDTLDLSRFKSTWYSSLTKLLFENVRKSDVENIFDNLTIVNFNYDRCLEHYLPISLANYYGLPVQRFQQIMQNLTIHRPYGMAGRLPWQNGSSHSVRFGQGKAVDIAAIAPQIRTFTERVEEGSELDAIKVDLADADRIIFIGFAFHRQNVELLSTPVRANTEIVATALNISKSDQEVIEQELMEAFQIQPSVEGRVKLANMECKQFFKEYWRTLTAEEPWEPTNF
jgi:hypothetical protein